jgi:methionyl aminopeptidase
MVSGNHVGDISSAVEEIAEGNGYFVTREYTGHGVGREMHEGPQVPNYGVPGQGLLLRKGMTIALEPMLLVGTQLTRVLRDQWTVISADRSLTGHFEHSVAITENGPMILTLLEDGSAPAQISGPKLLTGHIGQQ